MGQFNKLGDLLVRYYNNGWQRWLQSGTKPAKANAMVFVLARQHYRESMLWLPMVDIKAVRQAVKLEMSQYDGRSVYLVGEPVNGKTPVIFYLFNFDVSLRSGLWIPESLLLAHSESEKSLIRYDNGHCQVLLGESAGLPVSQLAKGMFQDPGYFCAAYGIADREPIDWSQQEHLHRLKVNWWRVPLRSLPGLWLSSDRHEFKLFELLKASLLPVALLFSCYLGASTTYIVWLQDQLQVHLTEQQSLITEALTLRNRVRSADLLVEQLDGDLAGIKDYWLLWPIVAPLYSMEGVRVERVIMEQGELVIRVHSDTSTQVLDDLLQHPDVASAKFDGTVRKVRGKEVVNIRLILAQRADNA